MEIDYLVEGETYPVKLQARSPKGEGIGHIQDMVILVKNAKARIGKTHLVKITKRYRTFAYGEIADSTENSKYFIGNGSLIV